MSRTTKNEGTISVQPIVRVFEGNAIMLCMFELTGPAGVAHANFSLSIKEIQEAASTDKPIPIKILAAEFIPAPTVRVAQPWPKSGSASGVGN